MSHEKKTSPSGNLVTENNGLNWLVLQLESEGWKVERVQRKGFDLLLRRGEEERFVELKTTEKPVFSRRWLEQKEYEVMQSAPGKYFVYLITEASTNPSLTVLNYDQLMSRKVSVSTMHWFDFRPEK